MQLINEQSSTAPFDQPRFFRANDGVYKRIESPWGSYYSKVPDPKGQPKPKELDNFHLHPNYAKLPAELLQAIITLFRHYLKDNHSVKNKNKQSFNEADETTEVQVCLLRKEDNPDIWKVVVPKQIVGAVTVDAVLNESCDILTGEEYTVFPPTGYIHAGSVHSHHSMACFWSSRDDRGELGVPGKHCTVGYLTQSTFGICCSIVLNKKRYVLHPSDCLDLSLCSAAAPIPNDHNLSWECTLASGTISDKVHSYITKPKLQLLHTAHQSTNLHLPNWSSTNKSKVKKKKKSKSSKTTDWSNWDNIDWAPRYDYSSSKYLDADNAEVKDPERLIDYLNSKALRQELIYILDLLYTSHQDPYDSPIGDLSQDQKEALLALRDLLMDLFESLQSFPGFELVVIDVITSVLEVSEDLLEPDLLDALDNLYSQS